MFLFAIFVLFEVKVIGLIFILILLKLITLLMFRISNCKILFLYLDEFNIFYIQLYDKEKFMKIFKKYYDLTLLLKQFQNVHFMKILRCLSGYYSTNHKKIDFLL